MKGEPHLHVFRMRSGTRYVLFDSPPSEDDLLFAEGEAIRACVEDDDDAFLETVCRALRKRGTWRLFHSTGVTSYE